MLSGRIAEKAGNIPESQVIEMWRDCLPGRCELVTEDGGMVRVVYPGRRNSDSGADFVDAVVATEKGLLMGDIEIHVRSSGWWAHKHNLDPAYNQVIMHVVYCNDIAGDIKLYNGSSVPTLALSNIPEIKARQPDNERYMPCHHTVRRLTADSVGGFLDAAGEERFHARTVEFAEISTGTGQALYEGIMTGLGYAKNKSQFLQLARCVPLYLLESIASGVISNYGCLAYIQARIMGMAGLLPSQRTQTGITCEFTDEWVKKLEKTWYHTGGVSVLSASDWNISRIRPGNSPVRRIAAMSYLLTRHRYTGLLDGLTNGFSQVDTATDYAMLEKSLMVDAGDYWAQNLDFHLPVKGIAPALLGRGRAADIIINILLPFAAANVSKVRAFDIYRQYPRLATNTLEKHMMQQLAVNSGLVHSARRQQGLIHIYRTLCSQGKCGECPLG